ncbi:MAG: DUF2680 domain-containing protein [Firmicutes bacterium]|nr:DUF2680 domain-containing protein [Bacillota bacterium]
MMRKMSLLLVGVLLLGLAVPAFANETTTTVTDWVEWHKDRIENIKKLIDARVEAGLLTENAAELWKENLNARQEFIETNPDSYIPGICSPAAGYGMGMGMGRGHRGGIMGSFGRGTVNPGFGFGAGFGAGFGPAFR